MSCNITKNKKGEYIVRADNGQPSMLFNHLKATLGNDRLSLEKWASTKTPEFKSFYADSNIYLDINGEPSMMYVVPENDFLYYGKKDQASSAKAKDKLNRQDDLKAIEAERAEQMEILKATILKQITQFKVAEAQGSRTNRYIDVANSMARVLHNNSDSVEAITKFISSANFYLKDAQKKLNTLKDTKDTNARLESLNELGQLLIIFNNLKQFANLTGKYEKSLFQVQMEGFFDKYGVTVNKDAFGVIQYGNPLSPKTQFKIRKDILKQVDRLRDVTELEKKSIIDEYDNLVANKDFLTSVLDDLLRERDQLESKLRNDYYKTVSEWLWPYVEEGQAKVRDDLKITKKDFLNQLKQAKQDAGIGEYTLASLSTINDPIAQAIRLAAEQARQDAHIETTEGQSVLSIAKKAQVGKGTFELSDYDKYLKTISREVRETDADGNVTFKTISTKAIIQPYLTENLERDRNLERQKQIDYFNALEEERISKLQAKTQVEGLSDKKLLDAINEYQKAKEDKDYNVSKAVIKAMNTWYETKYDIVKYKSDVINQKKKELSEDEFNIWYQNNIYKTTVSAENLDAHKRTRKKFVMLHPDNLNDSEIKNSSYYKPGREENGKVVEYYVYEIKYGGDFTIPKDEYIDPKYAALTNDKFFMALNKNYHKSNNILSDKHKLKHGALPQIEKGSKSYWDENKSSKENMSGLYESMVPDVLSDSNETEIEQDGVIMKVSKISQNVDGTQIKTIPVKFVSWLDDSANLDTNLIETFTKFAAVANRYKHMEKTNASARAIKNLIVGNPSLGILAREIALTDASGNQVLNNLSNIKDKIFEAAVKEKGLRLNNLLVDFIDDAWYGENETKEDITILGKKVSLNKLSNFTSKWVSIQRLAGNLDSAISNLVIGKLAIFNESIAGKFYTKSDYYEASKIINKELFDGTVIKDYMQEDINEKSLYAQMMIRHDAIQGEFSNEYGIKVSKKTALEMGKDFLFFSQNGMEYTIQKRSMLCISKGFKVALPDGMIYDREANEGQGALREATQAEIIASEEARSAIKEKYKGLIEKQTAAINAENAKKPTTKEEINTIARNMSKMNKDLENISTRMEDELAKISTNYFTALDAYTQDKDGAIKIKDFLKPYFGNKEENQLRRRIQELNKRQQGIYAQFDKSQAQRHWLGKLALMFRKYLYSAYEHRFGDQKVNLALGEETYGYQRQFINKFLADFKTYGAWAFTKLMDGSATPAEQYAINKTLTEYAVWASFLVLFWLMQAIGDDDDEESWAYSKTAYIVKRTEDSLSEFALPFGIGTMVRTFKNPISSITLVEQIYEVFAVIFDDPLNLGGVYERDSGINKAGDSKFLGKLFKVLPILRQYGKFITPEDQLKYYTQRKTNI